MAPCTIRPVGSNKTTSTIAPPLYITFTLPKRVYLILTPPPAADYRDGSDHFHRLDLRPSEAARCGGEGGTSADFGAIAASKKKNDRIDAGKIADCLRCAFLPECYMASTEIRERRRTLRYRHLLVRQVVQLADLITSCTLSFVSGENRFAPTTFQYVRPLLRSEANRIGGIGVKIHPESKYANLYHRLFGDQSYILHNVTYPLPLPGHPFPVSADRR